MRLIATLIAVCDLFGLFEYYTFGSKVELTELHYSFYVLSSSYFNMAFSMCYLMTALPSSTQITWKTAFVDISCGYFFMLVLHASFAFGRYSFFLIIWASAAGSAWAFIMVRVGWFTLLKWFFLFFFCFPLRSLPWCTTPCVPLHLYKWTPCGCRQVFEKIKLYLVFCCVKLILIKCVQKCCGFFADANKNVVVLMRLLMWCG